MRRRRLLATLGAGAFGLIGGCNRGDAAGTPTTTPTATSEPTTTPTATGTPTATPTTTPTATPSPTATGPPTHAVGERFVVPGSPPFAYTFHGFYRADSLGPFDQQPSQGLFVVADATVENRGRTEAAVPTEDIVLRGNVRLYARLDDTDAAAADDRVESRALTNTVAFPRQPVRGVLAFDAPRTPTNRYYLRITPPGVPEEPVHHVPVGAPPDIPPLE